MSLEDKVRRLPKTVIGRNFLYFEIPLFLSLIANGVTLCHQDQMWSGLSQTEIIGSNSKSGTEFVTGSEKH